MLLEIIIAAALVAAFIVEVVLTETENFGWSTLLFLVVGGACYYFNIYGVALWVKAHVLETLLFAGAYLVAGVIWSFIKWASYLYKYRETWREAKDADAKKIPELITRAQRDVQKTLEDDKRRAHYEPVNPRENIPQTPEEWENYVKKEWTYSHFLKSSNFTKPLASEHKSKIIAWMCFWPFSLLGTFINDPIRRLFNFLFSYFKAAYQKLSDKMFEGLAEKDKEVVEEEE